jgi:hypothetical protein
VDGARERWIADFDGAGVCLAQLHLHPHPTPHIMQAIASTPVRVSAFTGRAVQTKASAKVRPPFSSFSLLSRHSQLGGRQGITCMPEDVDWWRGPLRSLRGRIGPDVSTLALLPCGGCPRHRRSHASPIGAQVGRVCAKEDTAIITNRIRDAAGSARTRGLDTEYTGGIDMASRLRPLPSPRATNTWR